MPFFLFVIVFLLSSAGLFTSLASYYLKRYLSLETRTEVLPDVAIALTAVSDNGTVVTALQNLEKLEGVLCGTHRNNRLEVIRVRNGAFNALSVPNKM